MWFTIMILVIIGLLFKIVESAGKKRVKRLSDLENNSRLLRTEINEIYVEHNRLKAVGSSIELFKNSIPYDGFLGLESNAKTVAEHTMEFANEIAGHKVDIWIYTIPFYTDRPMEIPAIIAVAGHANGPVCREVSAALSTTLFGKDEIKEEDFFVTGAGMLVDYTGQVILEDIKSFLSRLSDENIPPLVELRRQLSIYQDLTGLVNLHQYSLTEYNQTESRIVSKIEETFISGKSDIFGNNSHDEDGLLLILPFYRYENKQLKHLRFTIDKSCFGCEEFNKLKDRHRRALIQEMKNDVRTRNRIYKDWLEKDEMMMRQFKRMTPYQRETEEIEISGSRHYSTGKTTTGTSKKKIIHKYIDEDLIDLIKEDKRWLARTDFELERLEKHDKEAGLADKMGYSILMDSFLRGWPSIFLSSENERKHYDKWVELKREQVWKDISEKLLGLGISPASLLHTNTIFKVKSVKDNHIEIEPNYVLLTNAFIISVDTKENLARFIHPWEHRELQRLTIDNKWVSEEELPELTETLFERGMEFLEKDNINYAKQYFALALRCDTKNTFIKLISHWWHSLTRDTSSLYKERVSDPYLRALIIGMSLPEDATDEEIRNRLANMDYCIQEKPEELAEPYIMRAVLEVYPGFIRDQKETQRKFENKARERFIQIKRDFKQGKLLPEVMQTSLTEEEMNKLGDPQYGSATNLRSEKERVFEKVFMKGLLMIVSQLKEKKPKQDMNKLIDRALNKVHHHEIIKFGIREYARGDIRALSDNDKPAPLFDRVISDTKANAYLDEAKIIDSELVEKTLEAKSIQNSHKYSRIAGAYINIAKADRYLEYNNWIVKLLIRWQKYPDTSRKMNELLNQYEKLKFPLTQDEKMMIEKLGETVELLKKFVFDGEDSMYLPMAALQSVQADLLNTASKLYKNSPVYDLMEGNKARVLIASQNHAAYQEAIRIMTENRPLRLITRDFRADVVDSTVKEIDNIEKLGFSWDGSKLVISAFKSDMDNRPLLVLSGITEEDSKHIQSHFSDEKWHEKVISFGDNLAEMILNSRLPHIPSIRRFSEILNDPEISSILIFIMAYTNIHLVPEQMVDAFSYFDKVQFSTTSDGYVIGSVKVDFDRIHKRIL